MYPQSDIVVADDPFAEIAARTWMDEYSDLDRSDLLKMTYNNWLAQRPDVKEAIEKLNGKFLPNRIDSTNRKDQDEKTIVGPTKPTEPAVQQEQKKEGGKRRWWKR
ncbi:hypothetical protein BGZ63DRAFT_377641 [Mariannaea sp. PMI_226]|nr:hypothetical protein BGZ63DRAFT_377641 [Mariannaea sp. PMI_226]